MSRRLRQEDDAPHQAPWLNTYADMVTLLLCFFVLLFAMSVLNQKKFAAVASSLQGAFGILPGSSVPNPDPDPGGAESPGTDNLAIMQELAKMTAIMNEIQGEFKKQGMEARVTVIMEERGIVVRFEDSVLFDLGSADLRPEAREILRKVGGLLKNLDNPIRIEGHTDNWPIRTERFPSNWELSTGRASTVVRFLIDECHLEPKKLQAAGYGEYYPVASNDTPEGRQRNRRVDIIILRPSLAAAEPR